VKALQFHETGAIEAAADLLRDRLGGGVSCATILGSGFGSLAKVLTSASRAPFREVAGLGGCSAPGHEGEIVAGGLAGARHLFFSGRRHLYEGLTAGEVAVPVALARALGADRILLTCAAGATSGALAAGSLVLVEDHLNLTGENPLLTVPIAERRPPFLAMVDAYDREALDLAAGLVARTGEDPRRAVLAALTGPTFETPAEYRALARLGADIVSMSTVIETIAARSLGMKVLALAIVSNGPAVPAVRGPREDDVLRTVESAVERRLGLFERLLAGFAAL
jgi:purine-nucleoside phosphorylase